LISEIAAASNEQAQGIGQVSTAVGQMDQVTQQTAANAEESASASEELNAQAEQLQGMVQELLALVHGGDGGSGQGHRTGARREVMEPAYRSQDKTTPTTPQHSGGNSRKPVSASVKAKTRNPGVGPTDELIHRNLIADGGAAQNGGRKPSEVIPLDGAEELAKF
jgi:methyl-accepting chemotaxis protein